MSANQNIERSDNTYKPEDDEKTRMFLKAAYNMLQRKRDHVAKQADDIKTGQLLSPDGAERFADALEVFNKVQMNIGLLESIIRFL